MLDLVFTKLSGDKLSFDRGPPLGNRDHLSLCYDYVCLSWLNWSDNRNRNLRKGDFEGMKQNLHLQNWDTMLFGDIETKWLGFKTVLLDILEKCCPLARSRLHLDSVNVQPICKGSQCVDSNIFRPVSLTSTCSKVMERIIKFALIRFADSRQLMSKRQHGFLHERFTANAQRSRKLRIQ